MDDQTSKNCLDCFNCRVQILFRKNQSWRFFSHQIYSENKQLENLLNKVISYGSVRCAKGHWSYVNGKREFVYNHLSNLNNTIQNQNKRLSQAAKCPDFDGEEELDELAVRMRRTA